MNTLEVLEQSPELIARLEEIVATKRRAYDEAKHRLEVEKAISTVNHAPMAKNMKLLEAYVMQDINVDKAGAAVIAAQAELKMAEIDLSEAENSFISARKLFGQQNTAAEIRTRSSN